MDAPLVVWRFTDGKPGHDRQTAGLLHALAAWRPLAIHTIPVGPLGVSWWGVLRRRLPALLSTLPKPGLLVGAGHGCERTLLAARRACNAPSVYLMKPGLPLACFDLCLVPRHDDVAAGPAVELTQGVLNDLVPGTGPRDGPVPILVGGPSKHHGWDEAALLRQIASLVFGSRERHFVISDSRRTPAATSAQLATFAQRGVSVISHRDVGPDWLRDTLGHAADAWVTADSVSMLFEALTAGCAVGVLEVPVLREDRITSIAPLLVRDGVVASLGQWLAGSRLPRAAQPLAEAARCAAIVDARLLRAAAP